MTASTAASGPVANFRRATSAATWQRALMTCVLFASWIGVTAPAQGQAAPNVRITTPREGLHNPLGVNLSSRN